MKGEKLALLIFETVFSLTNLAFDLAKEQKPAIPDKPVAISTRMNTDFIRKPIQIYAPLNNFYNNKEQTYIIGDY